MVLLTKHEWLGLDLAAVNGALLEQAVRVAELISALDGVDETIVPGMTWPVRDLVTHLVDAPRMYTEYARGSTEMLFDVHDSAGSNRRILDSIEPQPLPEQAKALVANCRTFVDAVADRHSLSQIHWHGIPAPVAAASAFQLAELLLHGRDLARVSHRRWEIPRAAASHVVRAGFATAASLADQARATARPITYRVNVTDTITATWHIGPEGIRVAPPASTDTIDCRIWTDPVSFLLVAYGRRKPITTALTFKARALGRKPLAGLRLSDYLVSA